MQSGLVYILQSLLDLYLLVMGLRLAMQWVRADYRNSIVQFVVTVTNPLVAPLQKVVPPIYKIDTATLLVFLVLHWGMTLLLTQLTCVVAPDALTTLGLAVIRGLRLLLNLYFFVIFGYVLLSWIGQNGHNPAIAMLGQVLRELSEPILRPVQRIIPPIAGWDLTPIFVLLGLGALGRMLLSPAQQLASGLMCPLAGIL